MHIEEIRNVCITKGTTEELPFDENTLVFKVVGKMFALCNMMTFEYCNLKCNLEKAIRLRGKFTELTQVWHMNKKHWNTVLLNSSDISDDLARELISHSYNLVVSGLTKKVKKELEEL